MVCWATSLKYIFILYEKDSRSYKDQLVEPDKVIVAKAEFKRGRNWPNSDATFVPDRVKRWQEDNKKEFIDPNRRQERIQRDEFDSGYTNCNRCSINPRWQDIITRCHHPRISWHLQSRLINTIKIRYQIGRDLIVSIMIINDNQ